MPKNQAPRTQHLAPSTLPNALHTSRLTATLHQRKIAKQELRINKLL